MTPLGEDDSNERWALALAAIDVLVAAGNGIGGILLRARPGPVRDAWADALNLVVPTRRLPARSQRLRPPCRTQHSRHRPRQARPSSGLASSEHPPP